MKRKTYVTIPQSCHESWDAMTPQDKGRFCASCAKTVVDFSQMSDTQVLNYLSQAKGRLCGRFAQEQLERPLVSVKAEKKKIWWMAALMPLTLLFTKANAQKTDKGTINIEYNKCERSMGLVAVGTHKAVDTLESPINKIITGTIVDDNNIPIQGASVILRGTSIGTATNSTGNFHLSFPANSSSIKITISAIGFLEKEVSYTANDTNEVNINIQRLSLLPALMGDVVVVGSFKRYHPVKKIDTIKTTIRKVLRTNPFKLYPNPVNRGASISIEVKSEGHYSIQLLDANSKLVTYSLFDAVKGATTTAFTIPVSAAAGIYFIRLVNDDTKQQYTDKIIVQ